MKDAPLLYGIISLPENFIFRQRMTEIVTLNRIAMVLSQKFQLFYRLHPFCNNINFEKMGNLNNQAHKIIIICGYSELVSKCLIDFHYLNRKIPQVMQRRVSRSEIIENNMEAQLL